MYRVFGLARSPFAPVADGELYWESADRARLRNTALDALREGHGLWLKGPPGSGRGTFLERVAEDLALDGRPVLWIDSPVPPSAEGLLCALLHGAGQSAGPEGGLAAAEALYGVLIRSFEAAGACACFPGQEPLEAPSLHEALLLAGLRIAGFPIASVALCGAEEPPSPALIEISLAPFSRSEIQDCLAHRASACGCPDLLAPEVLGRIAESSQGIGEAVTLARRELARQAFLAKRSPLETEPPAAPPRTFFDSREVMEVGHLLDALLPGE